MVNAVFSKLGRWAFFIPLFAILGYVKEYAYFRVIHFEVPGVLGFLHFVFSSFYYFLILLLPVTFIGLVKKFFSRNIMEDDWAVARGLIEKMPFEKLVVEPRVQFCFCLVFLIASWGASEVGYAGVALGLSGASLGFQVTSILSFFICLYAAPVHLRSVVGFSFFVTLMCVLANVGLFCGLMASEKVGVVRDDFVVKVYRFKGGEIKVEPYDLKGKLIEVRNFVSEVIGKN